MNIHEHISKIKALACVLDKRDTYTVFIVIFASIGSFFLGKTSSLETDKKPITIEREDQRTLSTNMTAATSSTSQTSISTSNNQGLYVGSKSGTKYHLPDCPGGKMISETNKIWFSSKEEAQKAGYSPAGNCRGI